MKTEIPESTTQPTSQAQKKNVVPSVAIGLTLLVGFVFATLQTWMVWQNRPLRELGQETSQYSWKLQASHFSSHQTHIRFEGAGFWLPVRAHLLSKNAHIATQKSATRLYQIASGAQILLSAESVLHFTPASKSSLPASVSLLAGMVQVRGPLIVKTRTQDIVLNAGERRFFIAEGDTATGDSQEVAELGSEAELDLSKNPNVELQLSPNRTSHTTVEFSRDSNFLNVVFSQVVSPKASSTKAYIGDRAPGPWFVRLRDSTSKNRTPLAATFFQTFERLEPTTIVRFGQRWIAWKDQGPSGFYRLETSLSNDFRQIHSSILVHDRLFDLSRIDHVGQIYVRIVGVSPLEKEYATPPFAIDLPSKSELLRSGTETGNPELKLFARGWRIQLNASEANRIREGYVILKESELRGIRAAAELQSRIQANPTHYIFEISKNLEFSNPERVRPTSRGELLPPALPLGVIYTRLREVDDRGQFGAHGPASRISTLLPAPTALPARQTNSEIRLSWTMPIDAAGFEVKVSRSPEFRDETTTSHRTTTRSLTIERPESKTLYWTVTALHDTGGPISATSASSEVALQPILPPKRVAEPKVKPQTPAEIRRSLAAVNPSLVELVAPIEDAVIVGGATATKYTSLTWKDIDPYQGKTQSSYVVEIASDRDFFNIVERGTTSGLSYKLEGDLPEGSLFWRVRKKVYKDWSTSRRLELVYE